MDTAVNASTSSMAANSANTSTTIDLSYRVRSTFYALTLEETYIEHPKNVPNIVFEAIPIVFFMTFIELMVLRIQGKGDRFRLHNTIINYSTAALNESSRIFLFRGTEFAIYTWVYENLRLVDMSWDSPWTYIFALLGVDFCSYWWHRLSHEMSYMWAAHYVHHSSEDFNSSAGSRISLTMRPLRYTFFLPLAMVGLPPSTYMIHTQLGLLWSYWVHCEIWPKTHKIIPVFGHLLEFVMATPSHHRVHHAANRYCIDKNYGLAFIIWDRLFGTFVDEREDEPLIYGTISLNDNNHIILLQVDPWRDLWSRIKSVDSIWDKLRTLVYGPGWAPGKPRLGDFNEIPDVTGRKKYTFVAPRWLSLYLATHCIIIFVFFVDAGGRALQMSQPLQLLVLSYIFMAYGGLGGIYSAHQGSMWLEPARLLASVPMLFLVPVFHSERLTMTVITFNLLSLFAWPAVRRGGLSLGKKVE